MNKPIVLWTGIPSFHIIGPFLKLAKSHETFCVCHMPISSFRRDCWKIPDFDNLNVVYLKEQKNVRSFVEGFLSKTKEATHFISGFGNQGGTRTFWKIAPEFKVKPIAIAERPNPQKNPFKALLRDAYYCARIRAISRRISAVLCMGSLSVETFRKYGFPSRKLLQYMYTSTVPFPELPLEVSVGSPLRFVYVGRDDIWIKGLDLLVEALQGFSRDQLSFDFIGPDSNSDICRLICNNGLESFVRVLGKMPNDQIPINLANKYDVLALTSRYDGWGMTVSEAIFSGIGVLTSEACGSRDIVSSSGAGKIIPRSSVSAIRTTLRDLVNNPAVVREWKIRARAYREQLCAEKMASYLEEVITYVDRKCSGKKPSAYWVEKSPNSIDFV